MLTALTLLQKRDGAREEGIHRDRRRVDHS